MTAESLTFTDYRFGGEYLREYFEKHPDRRLGSWEPIEVTAQMVLGASYRLVFMAKTWEQQVPGITDGVITFMEAFGNAFDEFGYLSLVHFEVVCLSWRELTDRDKRAYLESLLGRPPTDDEAGADFSSVIRPLLLRSVLGEDVNRAVGWASSGGLPAKELIVGKDGS